MNVSTIPTGASRALVPPGHASETAVQAVLVALARVVQRAAAHVRAAEASALSLAQQQKVAGVADDLAATAESLHDALTDQGRCLLDARRSFREKVKEASEKVRAALAPTQEPAAASWWFALSEAVEALDDAAEQASDLAEAQPTDAPAA
ncbi:MAG: hypothetical protein R3181_13025, partial [Rubricoccaceae bacterium]|nr:hypothetical protein [Rubricoccaceae bacterium]